MALALYEAHLMFRLPLLLLLLLALAACGGASPASPPRYGASESSSAPVEASVAAAEATASPLQEAPAPAASPQVLAVLSASGQTDLLAPVIGVPFEIPLGGEFAVGDTGLSVSFAAVPEDSRCPANAKCIWQGRAVVTVEVLAGDAAAQSFALAIPGNLTPDAPELQAVGAYTLRLVDLAPYPASPGGSPGPYVATLVLERP